MAEKDMFIMSQRDLRRLSVTFEQLSSNSVRLIDYRILCCSR